MGPPEPPLEFPFAFGPSLASRKTASGANRIVKPRNIIRRLRYRRESSPSRLESDCIHIRRSHGAE